MDQTLDMQVAALIFLAGTRCLVTSDHTGGVETTREDEEDSDEPAPYHLDPVFNFENPHSQNNWEPF